MLYCGCGGNCDKLGKRGTLIDWVELGRTVINWQVLRNTLICWVALRTTVIDRDDGISLKVWLESTQRKALQRYGETKQQTEA